MRQRPTLSTWLAIALALLATAGIAQQDVPLRTTDIDGKVADVYYEGSAIFFEPLVDHESIVLTVATPVGPVVRTFERGETPVFDLRDVPTEDLDGSYAWELRVNPVLAKGVREALQDARRTGDRKTALALQEQGLLPSGPLVDSEGFRVDRSEIIDPRSGKESSEKLVAAASRTEALTSGNGSHGPISVSSGVVLTNADGVIRNSLCVGFDCPNNPSFSDSTTLFMENNTRLKFDDTSSINSFPRNDWEIEANSNLNGGASYLGFNDCGESSQGGCATDLVFAVEAGVRQNALYVESDGDVGVGTSNPVVRMHLVDGDTPTLRLAQDTSSGFAAQTWDVAGNETSFFVRDATNGSTLPFRIQPGTASNTLWLDAEERVGIRTTNPAEILHLVGTDNPRVLIEDTTDNANDKPGFVLRSPAAASAGDWAFEVDNNGNFQIDFGPSTGPEMLLSDSTTGNSTVTINGDLVVNGTCSGCDAVFQPEFELESIEEHAELMWRNSYLPGVGATPEGPSPINVYEKTTGILQELEKAHIYIEQLHQRLAALESKLAASE